MTDTPQGKVGSGTRKDFPSTPSSPTGDRGHPGDKWKQEIDIVNLRLKELKIKPLFEKNKEIHELIHKREIIRAKLEVLNLVDAHHKKHIELVESMADREIGLRKREISNIQDKIYDNDRKYLRAMEIKNKEISRLEKDIELRKKAHNQMVQEKDNFYLKAISDKDTKTRKLVEEWINPMKDNYCKRLMKRHFAEVLK